MEQPVTVLIVDDESAIRNGLKNAIPWSSIPAVVIALAANGSEALEIIREQHPDIVVTDIRMPEKDGIELIQEARKAGCESEFIILSGYNDFTYAQQAIKWGAKAYILKPYSTEELTGELKKLVAAIRQKKSAQNRFNRSDLPKLKDASKKIFLGQLLQNEIREDEIQKGFDTLELRVNTPLAVIIFLLSAKSEKAAPVCASLAEDILIKICAEKPAEVIKQSPSRLVVLLQVPAGANLKKRSEACLRELEQIPECSVCAGIGSIVPSIFLCHESFNCALAALSYRLYKPECVIFDSSIIIDSTPKIDINSIDVEGLADAVCRNSAGEVTKRCEDFFQSLFYIPLPPPGYVRGMCIYLVAAVQKELLKRTGSARDIFEKTVSIDINGQNSFYNIKRGIINLFHTYGCDVMPLIANTNDNIISRAKSWIEQHLEDGVSAEDVAREVHLSTAYFPIYFKAKTGGNFRDYLLDLKNTRAKQLLTNPAIPVEAISEKLGYADYRAFYRAFKKTAGLTPSEYRKQYDVRSAQGRKKS